MKIGKPKSKRTPVRLRHKIEKAAASKRKKDKKLAKKSPQWRSRLKKDPGIPNLFPYRDKIIYEIEEARRLKAEEAEKRRVDAKARLTSINDIKESKSEDGLDDVLSGGSEVAEEKGADGETMEKSEDSNPMAALLASARARAIDYSGKGEPDDGGGPMDEDEGDSKWAGLESEDSDYAMQSQPLQRGDTSRKAYDKIFKGVVEAADVILYVLDARNPEGTRSKEVERMILAADGGNKRLILVLNKVDLVPPAVLKGWLIHLKRYFPTLPIQAARSAANARTFNHKNLSIKGTSETLLRALKSYANAKQLKRSVAVGIIGYPNVGKSSVVNALATRMGGRPDVCPSGAEAGVTTNRREVKLDSKLKLLDSPGIVLPGTHSEPTKNNNKNKRTEEERASLVLLNAVPTKDIDDPIPAVSLLLKRLSEHSEEGLYSKLLETYNIPALMRTNNDPTTDFLVQVARKRGRLGKGGAPNLMSAAKAVITDWRDGRIPGWMPAPKLQRVVEDEGGVQLTDRVDENANGNTSWPLDDRDRVSIVKEWATEFKLEGLWGDGQNDDEHEQEQEQIDEDTKMES